jgi:subtilisin-like proprotein convertase family protein
VGFTGDSDWVVSAVDLTSYGNEPDLALRFVFGSGSNYEDYGWYIDWVALSKCGDGNITADEQCEGLNLQGETCESLGLGAGTLACDTSTCLFDASGCEPTEITECSTPGLLIPDLDNVIDTLTVTDSGTITDVNVLVQVTHGYTEDLDIRVQHLATGRWLVRDECGTANDVDAVFDDEGSALTCSNDPAIGGDVIPEEPLDAYDGLEAQGDWSLQIYDDLSAGTGTLDHWCVTITF